MAIFPGFSGFRLRTLQDVTEHLRTSLGRLSQIMVFLHSRPTRCTNTTKLPQHSRQCVCLGFRALRQEIWNMRKYLWIIIAALIVGVVAPSVKADTTYNMVTGFSNTSNPNGVWTYEYNGTPFTDAQGHSGVLPYWYNGGTQPDSIAIFQNVTGSSFVNTSV